MISARVSAQTAGPSAMKSLRVGRSSSGRTVATSSTESPSRTPTRGAPAPVAYTPYGRWSRPKPSVGSGMGSLQQSQPDEVVEGLTHAARAVGGEPPARTGQVAGAGQRDEVVGVVVVEHLGDLRHRAAVEGAPGREQHVEEPVVLEAGLVVAVAHGVMKAGRALVRRLAVERGVDPGRDGAGLGEEVGLGPAGAELQAGLGLGHGIGR